MTYTENDPDKPAHVVVLMKGDISGLKNKVKKNWHQVY